MPKLADLSVKTKDVWEIPRESLQLIKKLGNGQFGEVWMGMMQKSMGMCLRRKGTDLARLTQPDRDKPSTHKLAFSICGCQGNNE